MPAYFEDQLLEKQDYKIQNLPTGDYAGCTFNHCDFSGTSLSGVSFEDCVFSDCNFSLSKLHGTTFRDVKFNGCKMLGLHFEDCNPYGLALQFDHCILNHSSFYKAKIRKTVFKNTQLIETDFTEADLTGSVFTDCELSGAKFEQTILEKTDLRGAVNFIIDPEINKIKRARFGLSGLPGLLTRYDIEIDHKS
ncbi:pentapeptide repeat-containing protein [Sediminibacterium ginsengisoli]|uniref:Uncharacterized protein YjbI, contains pentapeptide repeats n=1 Tax=Sediminibacterium ginsengisoli TaxID=413434 RepID=A0A1T4L6S6_9BACT|nr:pentapeptide repeat-containing protein [Sediminibacterium ginsengisoli]SJZ50432.1 Uncharacterized protein YjbI, contains pentapeptide repeats [Sediminibacterium ginsengisoli]